VKDKSYHCAHDRLTARQTKSRKSRTPTSPVAETAIRFLQIFLVEFPRKGLLEAAVIRFAFGANMILHSWECADIRQYDGAEDGSKLHQTNSERLPTSQPLILAL
jgi:hypothetical protein